MRSRSPVGHPLPASVGTYFDAIDRSDGPAADRCFSRDAVFLGPSPEGGRRTLARAEITDMLAARPAATWHHDIVVCLVDGDAAFVEGDLVDADGTGLSTFVVFVELATDGAIARFEAFRGPLAERLVSPDGYDVDDLAGRLRRSVVERLGAPDLDVHATAIADGLGGMIGSYEIAGRTRRFVAIGGVDAEGSTRHSTVFTSEG